MASTDVVATSTSKKGTRSKGPRGYPWSYPCHVDTTSFLSIKLSGKANHGPWKEQMTCLLESYDMYGFVKGFYRKPKGESPKYKEWKRSSILVKGWIIGSLSEDVKDTVVGLATARDVWKHLCPEDSKSFDTKEPAPYPYPYPYPCHVDTASFVSVKLSGKANHGPWKEQMTCLLESYDIYGFVDCSYRKPREESYKLEGWKRSSTLVKGWIIGSLSEDVKDTVAGLDRASDVWKHLCPKDSKSFNPIKEYRPLYRAIVSGDWEKALEISKNMEGAFSDKINGHGDSALHVAISTCENINLVDNLLTVIKTKSLPSLVTKAQKYSPLHRAAAVGNTKAAKMLVKKNPELLFIMDNEGYLPIHRAISKCQEETFRYLLGVTKEYISRSENDENCTPFEGEWSGVLLTHVIDSGLLDVAYRLINEYPSMAGERKNQYIPLKSIAGMSDAYYSGGRYNFYQRWVYSYMLKDNEDLDKGTRNPDTPEDNKDVDQGNRSCFYPVFQKMNFIFWEVIVHNVVPQMKHLQKDKAKHNNALKILNCICKKIGADNTREDYIEAIAVALENDIPEAIEEIIRYIPHAIRTKHNYYYMTQFAIVNRCEKVYNLLAHQMVLADKHLHRSWIDEDMNNLLHLAGRLAPIDKLNLVSGAALQMQRELQWFEEVKKFVHHGYTNTKNINQDTPIMVFRREHKDLRKEGEEWMKKTSESYTITAALIITIVFAAAITVPGGNDGNTGRAFFARDSSFIVFAVSNAISLFSSTTSLLLFLSILTTRYRDEDFLYMLPKRLIIGLTMLFLAVTSMMVAFSATLYIMSGQEKGWILISISVLTCLPIASFVTLQLPLLADLISSTYGHGIFDKQK